jgi:predicted esterase YcpF (UPF0227 family)
MNFMPPFFFKPLTLPFISSPSSHRNIHLSSFICHQLATIKTFTTTPPHVIT